MTFSDQTYIKKMTTVALYTALIWVGALVQIPLGVVPVTLQTFFIQVVAVRLQPVFAVVSVLLYLLLAVLGLPVLAGGTGGGLAAFIGPSGGYLWGFVIQCFLLSWSIEFFRLLLPKKLGWLLLMALLFSSVFLPYTTGVAWLWWRLDVTLAEALLVGVVPFIWSDILKAIVVILLAPLLLQLRWQQASLFKFYPLRHKIRSK